ncbi:hypothetical protein HT102_08215 [Hoyosella sp. G463]|uniref:HTH gntR-type domain-containing protein n=1 Tax=Lolliginicoccus lacisalsi TaxID=2742202 RepID=A0A927PMJ8_9ACTN|nr:hypothetical protein [Lolliginicoccus lacisalsi]MBD8506466.1 hypothetical protein [Lolliginicoccus lacisalsi]
MLLARQIGPAPGTVARACKVLEGEGYVTTRRGAGTRIAPGEVEPLGIEPRGDQATERLSRAAHDDAAIAAASGHVLAGAIAALVQAWEAPAGPRERHEDERQP